VGDSVLLPTDHGAVAARVVWAAEYSPEETEGFPVLLGMAGPDDLAATEQMRKTKARTMVASRKLIREHGLPMKVLAVDPQPSAGKTVIFYSSPETVDFRSLLRDLSATLGNRIELRQLAARDAVRVTGAIGSCGRDTCCSTFLKDYEPITLAMARDQELPANPMRISGACGRLMCCLKYEHPLYQDFKATAPAIGEEVESPAGPGRVVGHSVPGDSVVIKLAADGSKQVCPKASVCGSRKAYEEQHLQR
jgi:cell fate regulator YaaT (PSP1 superfamily)